MNPKLFQSSVYDLLDEQRSNWSLATANYRSLKSVRKKIIEFDRFNIEVQFNPERIRSTLSACGKGKAPPLSDCFLCEENLSAEQKYISFEDDFIVLVNPYPVFSAHLTIALRKHVRQTIQHQLYPTLRLASLLPDFIVFFNGAQCGASAPEHLHFQAGIKDEFPLFNDLKKNGSSHKPIPSTEGGIRIWKINDGLRTFALIESEDIRLLTNYMEVHFVPKADFLNVLVWYEENSWKVCVFARKKHRPDQFYATGDGQLLISPATVEMAGLIITPREEDFEKINKEDLISIFNQVI